MVLLHMILLVMVLCTTFVTQAGSQITQTKKCNRKGGVCQDIYSNECRGGYVDGLCKKRNSEAQCCIPDLEHSTPSCFLKRSRDKSPKKVTVNFENNRLSSSRLYWLDYEGKEVADVVISASSMVTKDDVTHGYNWIARDEDTNEILWIGELCMHSTTREKVQNATISDDGCAFKGYLPWSFEEARYAYVYMHVFNRHEGEWTVSMVSFVDNAEVLSWTASTCSIWQGLGGMTYTARDSETNRLLWINGECQHRIPDTKNTHFIISDQRCVFNASSRPLAYDFSMYMEVTFSNRRVDDTTFLIFVDYNSDEVVKATLDYLDRSTQWIYPGEVWIARDKATNRMLYFENDCMFSPQAKKYFGTVRIYD